MEKDSETNNAVSRFTFKRSERENSLTSNTPLQGRQAPFRPLSGNHGQATLDSLGFDMNKNSLTFKESSAPKAFEHDRIASSTREVEQSFTFARAPPKETWKERMAKQSPNVSSGPADNPPFESFNGAKLRRPFLPATNRPSQNPSTGQNGTSQTSNSSLHKNSQSTDFNSLEHSGNAVANRSPFLGLSAQEIPTLGTLLPQLGNAITFKGTRTQSIQRQQTNSLQPEKQSDDTCVADTNQVVFHGNEVEINEDMTNSPNSKRSFYHRESHELSNTVEASCNSDYGNMHDHEGQRNHEESHNDAGPEAFKVTLDNYIKMHRQEIQDAENRWKNATMEEWHVGKLELMDSMKKIVAMSTAHTKRKLAVYQGLYAGIDDHSRSGVKRQRTLLAVEKDAVEKTKELLSTLKK